MTALKWYRRLLFYIVENDSIIMPQWHYHVLHAFFTVSMVTLHCILVIVDALMKTY